jgi:hypothetical protein
MFQRGIRVNLPHWVQFIFPLALTIGLPFLFHLVLGFMGSVGGLMQGLQSNEAPEREFILEFIFVFPFVGSLPLRHRFPLVSW